MEHWYQPASSFRLADGTMVLLGDLVLVSLISPAGRRWEFTAMVVAIYPLLPHRKFSVRTEPNKARVMISEDEILDVIPSPARAGLAGDPTDPLE
jgi:hypothetical protein